MKKILTTIFGIILLSAATTAISDPVNSSRAAIIPDEIAAISHKAQRRQDTLDRVADSLGRFANVRTTNPQKPVSASFTQIPFFNLMNKPQIPDLSFKQIMRAFYGSELTRSNIDDEELSKMPHVGLGVADDLGVSTVALMHPTIKYNNSLFEPRFLVMIEKVKISDGRLSSTCTACAATADLYSFRRLSSGNFQLVSRSSEGAEFYGEWGRVGLDVKEISTNIKRLGKKLIGSVFKDGGIGQGETHLRWMALHLPEDNFINYYELGDAGGNNSGAHEKESPLHYDYEVRLNVLETGEAYYPIGLSYTGDKPTESYDRIVDVNFFQIVKFDPIEKKYK